MSDAPALARHDPYAALRVPDFRRYTVAVLALTLATQIQGVVVAWQIYALTRDPLSLGLIGLAEALPYISVALFAGHTADRVDRRTLVLLATAALVVCSGALLALALRPPPQQALLVRSLYLVIVVSGVARSFLQPARTALASELVPRALLPNAITWRSAVWQVAAVAGPAVGGLLYAWRGATAGYVVDVALLVAALLAFTRVARVRVATPRAVAPAGSIVESLGEGVRWLRGQPVMVGAMTLDLFSVLFGGATALLPIFAAEILHVGPQGLGALRAAPAAGAVLTSLALAHRPPLRRAGPTLLVVVALFGVTMIGFGLSRSFPLSLALLAASGAVDMVSVVVRSNLLQLLTPEHMLGRVSSVNQIFIGSSNEIGAFESGVAAKLLGAAPSVVLGGVLTLVVVGATAAGIPALRRLGRIEDARVG
jgi:MFS family permease